MKLYTRCKSCKEEVSFYSSVNERPELEMQKGKEFDLTCNSCYKKLKYHVNDFDATKSLGQKLTSFGIALALVIALILSEFYVLSLGLIFYGGIFLVPTIAFAIIHKQQQTQLNAFNRFKVKQ